jgi:flavin reductase (DIM6/NTAB) family NADH-FMN oxidoreductase RutF
VNAPSHSTVDCFDEILADLDYPMFVVTTAANGEQGGCLVGFASKSSIEPPLATVWLSRQNRTARIAEDAAVLVVHVLREGDDHLARLFGTETGDDTEKFAGVPWSPGPDDVPVLSACDWFAGRIVGRLPGLGDHTGYVLEPIDGERRHSGLPQLGFQRVRDLRPGHPS